MLRRFHGFLCAIAFVTLFHDVYVGVGQDSKLQSDYDEALQRFIDSRGTLKQCDFSAVGWDTPQELTVLTDRYQVRIDAEIDFERDLWSWTCSKTPVANDIPFKDLNEGSLINEKAKTVQLLLNDDGRYVRDLSESVIYADSRQWSALPDFFIFDPRLLGAVAGIDLEHAISIDAWTDAFCE